MPVDTPVLLKPAEAAAVVVVPVRTLQDWRYRRTGPPYVVLGRQVRYPLDDLKRWLEAQKRGADDVPAA